MSDKNVKEIRISCGGFPRTRKEQDKFYWIMEKTGMFNLIFNSKEIIVREVKQYGKNNQCS